MPRHRLGRVEAAGIRHALALATHADVSQRAPSRLKYDVGPIGIVWDAREPSPALQRLLQALRDAAPRSVAPGDQ